MAGNSAGEKAAPKAAEKAAEKSMTWVQTAFVAGSTSEALHASPFNNSASLHPCPLPLSSRALTPSLPHLSSEVEAQQLEGGRSPVGFLPALQCHARVVAVEERAGRLGGGGDGEREGTAKERRVGGTGREKWREGRGKEWA